MRLLVQQVSCSVKGVGRGKRFSGQGNDVPLAEVMYDSQASNGYQGGNEERVM